MRGAACSGGGQWTPSRLPPPWARVPGPCGSRQASFRQRSAAPSANTRLLLRACSWPVRLRPHLAVREPRTGRAAQPFEHAARPLAGLCCTAARWPGAEHWCVQSARCAAGNIDAQDCLQPQELAAQSCAEGWCAGRNGVYYGARLGKAVKWCRGFPFSVVPHPQYLGSALTARQAWPWRSACLALRGRRRPAQRRKRHCWTQRRAVCLPASAGWPEGQRRSSPTSARAGCGSPR